MEVDIQKIKELRERSGVGITSCKQALERAEGDLEKAIGILQEMGAQVAAKKKERAASEGIIGHYIHAGGKIGVLVEVNCETDFVARNESFQEFVKDIAMQIAASNPQYIKKEEVPSQLIEKEKSLIFRQLEGQGHRQKIKEKIVQDKLEKYLSEICLLEQPFIKDLDKKMSDYLFSLIARLGENIIIRRFTRYRVGE